MKGSNFSLIAAVPVPTMLVKRTSTPFCYVSIPRATSEAALRATDFRKRPSCHRLPASGLAVPDLLSDVRKLFDLSSFDDESRRRGLMADGKARLVSTACLTPP